ncbi:proline-rich receptor-like protein kinase PERK9 [Triticum aestivum]|uniref:proline-rich receptor-like protein kinase PERK9 n=1 Tax=Triticum aestivum TaxID=4565 RepID=UPI001D024C65|nr:proline-rich receptor-like protein kinase PERK9 [Triticum aestivum]
MAEVELPQRKSPLASKSREERRVRVFYDQPLSKPICLPYQFWPSPSFHLVFRAAQSSTPLLPSISAPLQPLLATWQVAIGRAAAIRRQGQPALATRPPSAPPGSSPRRSPSKPGHSPPGPSRARPHPSRPKPPARSSLGSGERRRPPAPRPRRRRPPSSPRCLAGSPPPVLRRPSSAASNPAAAARNLVAGFPQPRERQIRLFPRRIWTPAPPPWPALASPALAGAPPLSAAFVSIGTDHERSCPCACAPQAQARSRSQRQAQPKPARPNAPFQPARGPAPTDRPWPRFR